MSAVDCDVGDDGSATSSDATLPFPLVNLVFHTVNKIQNPAQREKIICIGVDYPAIPCRMARDALEPDVNCWQLEEMQSQIPTPVRCDHMVVGNTSRYLPQLATFESQTAGNFTWQQMHVVECDAIAAESRAPVVQHVRSTVVTGFSANHLSEFTVAVVVWTMDDFRGKDLECVARKMETAGVDVEVRRFKFWAIPAWMRLKQTQEAGEHAWKVVMIHTVLVERGLVLWADAGDRFSTKEALTRTLDYVAEHGFATKTSGGGIGQWTRKV